MLQLILGPLLTFLGGPVITGLVNAYKEKLAAANTQDQHALDLAKADLLAQIEARKEATVLAGGGLSSLVQFLFALPIIVYMFKVIVWDKVLAWGSTDPITGAVGDWVSLIIGFYFGGKIVSGVVGAVTRRLTR